MERALTLAVSIALVACGPPAELGPRRWEVAHEEPSAALLGVWAGDGEVLAVGADDGSGPALLRRTSVGFTRVPVAARGALWWITRDGDGLLLVGENGLAVSLAAADAVPVVVSVPTDHTLFGAWVAPDGTAWAVGGDVLAEGGRGRMLVRERGVWRSDERIDPTLLDALLFKVWGRASDDVWAVGERGTVLHFDGASWTAISIGSSARLLTIHGTLEDGPYAVGGLGNATLLEWRDAFVERAPDFLPALNGVFVRAGGGAVSVGNSGTIIERDEGGAWSELLEQPTTLDLHATAIDEHGDAWAVGGALFSAALDHGVIVQGTR